MKRYSILVMEEDREIESSFASATTAPPSLQGS